MSEAVAFLITFVAYGTRLHGDPRGTALRRWNADVGAPPVETNALRAATDQALMKNPTPYFAIPHRRVIAEAVREVCAHKGWFLHGMNVRTNHVHVVVTTDGNPETAMTTFKAWCTRHLRAAGLAGPIEKVWSRHGSTLYLWDEQDVIDALGYVLEGQGPDLP